MITVEQYFMGRDKEYAGDCTDLIIANAHYTVEAVNTLLAVAKKAGVEPGVDQITKTPVASGWRPPAVNDRTCNAAKGSTHLTAEGCDLQDHPDRRLARWCLRNQDELEEIGLWMENPRWCYGNNDPWVHLQTRPPKSGNRVFIPSTAPPQCEPLPEQI